MIQAISYAAEQADSAGKVISALLFLGAVVLSLMLYNSFKGGDE